MIVFGAYILIIISNMGQCCNMNTKNQLGSQLRNTRVSRTIKVGNIRKHYNFTRDLGHGSFGIVREAICYEDKRKYAIKSVPKELVEKDWLVFKRELEVLLEVDHPNIVYLHETWEDEKYIHMVMELCTGGDLFDYIVNKGNFTESVAASIFYQ